MNGSISVVLTSTGAFFCLAGDITRFGYEAAAYPVTQSQTSKLYIFLSEVLNFPGAITDEHLASISANCFQGKNSVHDMMDQLNNKFNEFLDHLKKRGVNEGKEVFYGTVVDAIISSQSEGRLNYVVKGKRADGSLDNQIFLTVPTNFHSAVPHYRGTYTPPQYSNSSATAEITAVS